MSKISFTIVVPTIGRKSLCNTLDSIINQKSEDDEVFVIADGTIDTRIQYRVTSPPYFNNRVFFFETKHFGLWGHPQRNLGFSFGKGTHLATIDDDDVYTPNALATFRKFASNHPVIFQMQYEKDQFRLWQHKGRMECGNYGTPCFLIPNKPPLPQFTHHYAGDADYIQDAVDRYGEPIWIPKVVALIRPGETK